MRCVIRSGSYRIFVLSNSTCRNLRHTAKFAFQLANFPPNGQLLPRTDEFYSGSIPYGILKVLLTEETFLRRKWDFFWMRSFRSICQKGENIEQFLIEKSFWEKIRRWGFIFFLFYQILFTYKHITIYRI